jgi:hypothetical protein
MGVDLEMAAIVHLRLQGMVGGSDSKQKLKNEGRQSTVPVRMCKPCASEHVQALSESLLCTDVVTILDGGRACKGISVVTYHSHQRVAAMHLQVWPLGSRRCSIAYLACPGPGLSSDSRAVVTAGCEDVGPVLHEPWSSSRHQRMQPYTIHQKRHKISNTTRALQAPFCSRTPTLPSLLPDGVYHVQSGKRSGMF